MTLTCLNGAHRSLTWAESSAHSDCTEVETCIEPGIQGNAGAALAGTLTGKIILQEKRAKLFTWEGFGNLRLPAVLLLFIRQPRTRTNLIFLGC